MGSCHLGPKTPIILRCSLKDSEPGSVTDPAGHRVGKGNAAALRLLGAAPASATACCTSASKSNRSAVERRVSGRHALVLHRTPKVPGRAASALPAFRWGLSPGPAQEALLSPPFILRALPSHIPTSTVASCPPFTPHWPLWVVRCEDGAPSTAGELLGQG